MKYRILEEITKSGETKYRAYVGKPNRFEQIQWIAIEEDNNLLVARHFVYNTIEEAEKACKSHHVEKGYESKEKIVKEFEL